MHKLLPGKEHWKHLKACVATDVQGWELQAALLGADKAALGSSAAGLDLFSRMLLLLVVAVCVSCRAGLLNSRGEGEGAQDCCR